MATNQPAAPHSREPNNVHVQVDVQPVPTDGNDDRPDEHAGHSPTDHTLSERRIEELELALAQKEHQLQCAIEQYEQLLAEKDRAHDARGRSQATADRGSTVFSKLLALLSAR